MISVIIPLYNKEMYISDTIQRVLQQSFQNFEIIVVNDGSTDRGPEIIRSIGNGRIRLIEKENGGVSSARNRGIEEAIYDYVAFLDADDEWLPNHLEILSQLIEKYGDRADVFVTNFARKYPNGNVIPNRTCDELSEGIVENYFKKALSKSVIHTSCVCVKKDVFNKIEKFKTFLKNGEDIDVWVRLARKFKIAYSPKLSEHYLIGSINNSVNRNKRDKYGYYISLFDCTGLYDFLFHCSVKIKFYINSLRYRYK